MPTTDSLPDEPELTEDDLSPVDLLAECEDALLWRRCAEVRDIELVAHWAMRHGTNPKDDPSASRHDHLVQVGGEGTPLVRDLCIGDLALARQTGWMTTRAAMADILDLQHRLPRTWAIVRDFRAELWVARKVAVLSRGLGIDTVGVVDAAVARAIAGEAPSRVLDIARAKIIEADPVAHAHKVAVERAKRYVTTSRTDEHGLRHVIARVTAGDAVWIDAMVQRVAEILRARLDDTGVPPQEQPSQDVLRSEAFGWLARPAELLQLLLEAGTTQDHPEHDSSDVDQEPSTGNPDSSAGPPNDTDDAGFGEDPGAPQGHEDPLRTSRTTALPADLLATLRSVDPATLRPRTCLYVHVTAGGLADPARHVARIEDHGPVAAHQLTALLRHAHVTVTPVIDLREAVTVNAYEHPESLKERIWLLTGGDKAPFATGASGRKVDYDHPSPWHDPGAPGQPDSPQTGTHNSQPLNRRHHRWKTHTGVEVTQLAPGTYWWRTRHGATYLVDPTGTHRAHEVIA